MSDTSGGRCHSVQHDWISTSPSNYWTVTSTIRDAFRHGVRRDIEAKVTFDTVELHCRDKGLGLQALSLALDKVDMTLSVVGVSLPTPMLESLL